MRAEQIVGLFLFVVIIGGMWFLIMSGNLQKILGSRGTATVSNTVASGGGTGINNNSSFYRKVRMSASITPEGDTALTVQSFASGVTIDITGWRIESQSHVEYIPKVSSIYLSNGYASPEDIIMKTGDTFTIASNLSPIRENIHVNECMGYLEMVNTFTPSLRVGCFVPYPEELAGLSGQCRAFIQTIPACASIHANDAQGMDNNCRTFLDTLNYEGCVRAHQNSPTFLKGDWRVWIGVPFINSLHDTIVLKDRDGKVVDRMSY